MQRIHYYEPSHFSRLIGYQGKECNTFHFARCAPIDGAEGTFRGAYLVKNFDVGWTPHHKGAVNHCL